MEENKFRITEKVVDNLEIVGYIISDSEEKSRTLRLNDIVSLCKKNMIENAEIIEDKTTNKFEILVNNLSTNNKEVEYSYEMVCRVVKKDGLNGYIIKDKNGKSLKLDINKAWKIANKGMIKDIQGVIISGKKVIRGINGFKLESLPILN